MAPFPPPTVASPKWCMTRERGCWCDAEDCALLHGQARIRGTRIPVSLVLGCLAEGMTEPEILAQYPSLSAGDPRGGCLWCRAGG